ncbi:hypothetical protein [Streptomyces sp. NPDC050560]|uniref:hypothetical protein n=1 Tax=Streptomyces sp. NPDC050560 TaxID=3365630 RepID=UPI0037886F6F
MDALVGRLCAEGQKVAVGGPSPSVAELQRRLTKMGYVFIKFTESRGGTDLGVRVDTGATDVSGADFAGGRGVAHIEGTLTLNTVKVRCVADIELSTLSGTGHLIALNEGAFAG